MLLYSAENAIDRLRRRLSNRVEVDGGILLLNDVAEVSECEVIQAFPSRLVEFRQGTGDRRLDILHPKFNQFDVALISSAGRKQFAAVSEFSFF